MRKGLTDLWFPRRKRGRKGETSWFRLTYTHYFLQKRPQGTPCIAQGTLLNLCITHRGREPGKEHDVSSYTWVKCLERHPPNSLLCSVAQSCLTLCTPWTVASQSPLSMEFSRKEYWSGLPFPPSGIFLTQGSDLHLPNVLHCRQILYCWAIPGKTHSLLNQCWSNLHWGIPSHRSGWPSSEISPKKKCCRGRRENGILLHSERGAQGCSQDGKQHGGSWWKETEGLLGPAALHQIWRTSQFEMTCAPLFSGKCQEAFKRRLPVCCFGSVLNPLFLIKSWIFRN